MTTEEEIRDFWNTHPCGDHQVESLKGDYEAFFSRYDELRYKREGHILRRLDQIDFEPLNVQCRSQSQTGNSASDDQNPVRVRHGVLPFATAVGTASPRRFSLSGGLYFISRRR